MEWKKIKEIMRAHDVTPEFVIHSELNKDYRAD
jgi:hypothetical protein